MARRKRALKPCPSCGNEIAVRNFATHLATCDRKAARREGVKVRRGPVFKRREKIVVAVVLLVLLGVAGWQFMPPSLRPPPGIGDDAPELTWSTGTLANYLGKVVLVNFMDVDCGSCQNETGLVHRPLYEAWVNEIGNVVFLSVNLRFIGPDNDEMDIWNYKAKYDARWQFLNDDETGKAARAYGVRGAPTNFVLDQELKIVHIFKGAATYAQYNNLFMLLNS